MNKYIIIFIISKIKLLTKFWFKILRWLLDQSHIIFYQFLLKLKQPPTNDLKRFQVIFFLLISVKLLSFYYFFFLNLIKVLNLLVLFCILHLFIWGKHYFICIFINFYLKVCNKINLFILFFTSSFVSFKCLILNLKTFGFLFKI